MTKMQAFAMAYAKASPGLLLAYMPCSLKIGFFKRITPNGVNVLCEIGRMAGLWRNLRF
jgi:hypothetical protein